MRIVTSDKGVEIDGVLLPDGRHVINGVTYDVKRSSVVARVTYDVKRSSVVARGTSKVSTDWVLLALILGSVIIAGILALRMEP